MNELYPEITPYNDFVIKVDGQHQLYVEECGNPEGQPVLFIHGGPGGGCSQNDRRFFDPKSYRIILFDQRGCGRSLPHGCLDHNETPYLIEDIEKIRQHLSIDAWHVFGGSWGSTLSLVYAQAHPKKVNSLVLRGIFLARSVDTHWTFGGGGATRIFPDYWQEYLAELPAHALPATVKATYDLLLGEDKVLAQKIATAWSIWEIRCCTLLPNKAYLAAATADDSAWTLARHEAHYMVNNCFLTDNQILANCDNIKDIPMTIVHGRYDIVCPADNAWLLHQALPKSNLIISEGSGHASMEPETKHHLLAATQAMLTINKD